MTNHSGHSWRDADAGRRSEATPPNWWPFLMRLRTGVAVLAEQVGTTTPLLRRVPERIPDQGVSRFIGKGFAPLCVGQAVFNF
jgi:hypothetical protein